MPNYEKPPLTYDQQLRQLQDRGLKVSKRKQALQVLATIGYYRLSGYWNTLLVDGERERFIEGAIFEEIYLRYQFDSSLRQLSLYAINHIEIALRASLTYEMSHHVNTGAWLQILDLFHNPYQQAALLKSVGERLEKSNEPFAKHYKAKYKASDPVPPAWIALQLSYFSEAVRLYENVKENIVRDRVANSYKLHRDVLQNWLNAFWELRNRCAHHSPIWNRNPKNQPMWPKSIAKDEATPWVSTWGIPINPDRKFQFHSRKSDTDKKSFTLYAVLCCATHMIDNINPKNTMRLRLKTLLSAYHRELWIEAGFSDNWQKEPIWNI